MSWKLVTRTSLLFAVGLAWTHLLSGQEPNPSSTLEGVWGTRRDFGPAVRGTLDIARSDGSWRAQIAQYDQKVVAQNDRLSFELPAAQGSFVGRLGRDNLIRGHWIQPPTVNDGGNFNSPVILRPTGKDRWCGEVSPLEDEWTVYLVVSRKPDGTLGAFIRNPDRNIGVFWDVDRVDQEGNRIKLIGKFHGRGAERVFGEGTYNPKDNRISIYFPDRGGTYDFAPTADDPTPGFYARGKNPRPYEYRPPASDNDGWKVGTLEEVGMVSEPIAELVRTISVPATSVHDDDIHGFLVARHGKLVAEEYFHGFYRLKPHDTRSASKSVTATLVGAAIQNGAKLDPSTSVYDLLYKSKLPQDIDPRKKEMTVEHLLTMSSGYDCDDNADSPRPGSEDTLTDEQPDRDYYRYTLQLPMELKPGQQAVYCSINANLLGAVLRAATQRPVQELFQDLIAEPLQIQRYYLNPQPTGEPYLGGGMHFFPRDFMKFGQLMLDGGVWNGKRILSKEYALRASSSLVTLRGQSERMKYGYLWWTIEYPYKGRTVRAYFASGNGGQEVLVVPELDMVIACYGGSYADRGGWVMIREYIPKYILPALKDESR
jgi:CubicO group peptidase (beta-lactamase class C family)